MLPSSSQNLCVRNPTLASCQIINKINKYRSILESIHPYSKDLNNGSVFMDSDMPLHLLIFFIIQSYVDLRIISNIMMHLKKKVFNYYVLVYVLVFGPMMAKLANLNRIGSDPVEISVESVLDNY